MRFRKRVCEVDAYPVTAHMELYTPEGIECGNPGDWLLDDGGQKQIVTARALFKFYEPVDGSWCSVCSAYSPYDDGLCEQHRPPPGFVQLVESPSEVVSLSQRRRSAAR